MSIFDENHKKILSAFLELKNKTILLEKHVLRGVYNLNKNSLSFIYAQNYFTNLRHVCDLPIVFMINEELSNNAARHLCPDLLEEILKEKHLTATVTINGNKALIPKEDFLSSLTDIRELLSNRINAMVGSLMLDFTVSIFSCFEHWITKLYESFEKFEADYEDSRRRKLKCFLKGIEEAQDEETQQKHFDAILSIRGTHRSLPDKINSIYKMVNEEKYGRVINHDKKIIEFLSACRNTVHNSGIHKGKPRQIEHRGIVHRLEDNKSWSNSSYPDAIEFISELTDIYSSIISSIDVNTLDSVATMIEDETAIRILDHVATMHLVEKPENNTDFKIFLENRYKLNELQAENFINRLDNIRSEDSFSPEDFMIYEVLTADLSRGTPI